MQGNPDIDVLMIPTSKAIKKYVKDRDAFTEIYNRAYEAVIISMEAKDAELEAENEKINYFFRKLRMFCIFAHWDNPNTEAEFYKVDAEIREYLSEYKVCIDQLTAHDATERQDDKSPNDTQTQTFVYGKWIPVGERLPECEKDVLVFWGKASDGSKIDWFGTAWRNECDDGKWCTDPIVPTHWMPLPEPPIVYGKVCEE